MSASDVNSSIYMSDTPAQIKNKVNKHGFSGGKETEEEHRMYGGDTEVDVSYQYLTFFLEDDEELNTMGEVSRFGPVSLIGSDDVTFFQDYRAGRLLTGQLKAKCIQLLQNFVKDFQEVPIHYIFVRVSDPDGAFTHFQRKAKVTDDDIRKFMDPTRKITPKFGKPQTHG
jgi:tryptophanyl-tRNA synthetase